MRSLDAYHKSWYAMGILGSLFRRASVKSRAARRVQPQQDQSKAVTVRIPFIDGLSQEVRRVARTAGVRCTLQ